MESVVADIVADAFPEASIETINPTRTGNFKQTVVVTLADRPSVVVQFRELAHGHLRPEAQVTTIIGDQTTIPVPPVLAVGDIEEYAYVVTERVPGVNLHERIESLSPDQRSDLVRTLGRFLGKLHRTFSFETYGEVRAVEETLRTSGPERHWHDWLEEYAWAGLEALPGSLELNREQIGTAITDGLENLPDHPTPRLYPWDYRPGNVLLEDNDPQGIQIAAVLDWGDPLAAHRELSLAKAEYVIADWYADQTMANRLRSALYRGYKTEISIPPAYWNERRRIYRLIGIVRSAVDSQGAITRPRSPMVDPETAADFHQIHLRRALEGELPPVTTDSASESR